MKQNILFIIILSLISISGFGCQMAQVIQKNTEGIEKTAKSIDDNTAAVL